nr:spore coat U domain-containing protein [Mesorhizobium camelthorni]
MASAAAGESVAQTSCSVSATGVSFGTIGILDTAVDTTGDLAVTCTSGASYTVGLNGGLANAQPTARLLADGAATITYGLYKDSARSQPWGDETVSNGTQSGTGSGQAQSFTIYGRIPAQMSPIPGVYGDTITVTVTY